MKESQRYKALHVLIKRYVGRKFALSSMETLWVEDIRVNDRGYLVVRLHLQPYWTTEYIKLIQQVKHEMRTYFDSDILFHECTYAQ